MTSRDWMRSRGGVLAAAAGHLAIGAVLAGRQSLWGDEGFTAESVRLPLPDLLALLTRIDVNMAAYYLMLKGWTSAFGYSEVALRLPSLLMTTATVLVAALLVARWFGDRAGLVTAIALAFNPFAVWIGLTARPFAMLGLLTAVSLGAFAAALGSRRAGPWALLAVLDVLALYTSLLAALVIGAQVTYLLLVDRRPRWGQVLAGGVLLVGAVPAALYVAPSNTLGWLTTRGVRAVLEVGWTAVGLWSGLVLAVLVLLGLVRRPLPVGGALRDHPRARWLLPVFVLVPVAAMVALLPKQSLFTPPYLVAVVVAGSMLAGAAAVVLPVAWARATTVALGVLLAAGIVVLAVPRPGLSEEDWRTATAELRSRVAPGDTVVFPNTFYRVVGEYYARSNPFTSVASPALPSDAWFSRAPDEYDRLKRTSAYADPQTVVGALTGRARVWLVGPDEQWMTTFTRDLTSSGWVRRDQVDAPGVVLRLLVPPASSTG